GPSLTGRVPNKGEQGRMADETNPDAMRIDVELVRQLAQMLDETQLTEIEVEDGGRRIRIARKAAAAAAPVHYAPAPPPAPAATAAAPEAAAPAPSANSVKSPMVGTVYLAPEPGA